MTIIQGISRSKFTEEGRSIRVTDLAPSTYQDLSEWRGGNSGRGYADEMRSVELDGFFNRVNVPGGVLTITSAAYAKAGECLRPLIDKVLRRELPLPYPFGNHFTSVFVGELIVEGYARTQPFTEDAIPADAVSINGVWVVPLRKSA